MRLLLWNQNFVPSVGGVESLTLHLAHGMQARGHEVAVVAGRHRPDLEDTDEIVGIPVYRFDFQPTLISNDLDAITRVTRAVARLKDELRPDIMHVHFTDPGPYFHLRTARGSTAVDVLSFLAPPDGRQVQPGSLGARLLQRAAAVIAPSHAAAGYIAEWPGAGSPNTQVIHPPIPALPIQARIETPMAERAPIITFVGRLVEEKGVDTAIEAVSWLRRAGRRVTLRIIGDGPDRERLQALAASMEVTADVDLVGPVADSELPRLLSESVAVIVPSRVVELFGIVALQAARLGLPVVASDSGSLPEVVPHEEAGIIVPIGEVGGLADAIRRLLDDRALAERLGSQGRDRATRIYGYETALDAYESLYLDVLR